MLDIELTTEIRKKLESKRSEFMNDMQQCAAMFDSNIKVITNGQFTAYLSRQLAHGPHPVLSVEERHCK